MWSSFPIKAPPVSTRCLSMRPLVCTLQNSPKARAPFFSQKTNRPGKISRDNKSDTRLSLDRNVFNDLGLSSVLSVSVCLDSNEVATNKTRKLSPSQSQINHLKTNDSAPTTTQKETEKRKRRILRLFNAETITTERPRMIQELN